jgi:hypothetical protein
MKLPTFMKGITFACALTAITCPSLLANAVSGSFDIGGSSATITQTALVFNCTPGITNAPCPPGSPGNFVVSVATGADFTPYVGEGGYVKNLSEGTTPLNTVFSDPNWLTFFTGPVPIPDIALDLQFIDLGLDPQTNCLAPPAPGQTCTPIIPALIGAPNDPTGLSSFNLQNLANGGSSASFTVEGTARRISTGETSKFSGTFTAALDVPYQTALSQILAGIPFTHTDNASFIITITPEPNLVFPLLFGSLLAVFLAGRYRRQQSSKP